MIKISDPIIEQEELEAAARALKSGTLARGDETKRLEELFARYTGTEHAIATSSGTTALHAALLAHGISSGEVITPAFSFVASANSILYTGAKPIFADADHDDFCIDPVEEGNYSKSVPPDIEQTLMEKFEEYKKNYSNL